MRRMTSKTATKFYAKLTANTDAWYADAIDHPTFRANQRVLWDSIDAAGCRDDVLALLRGGR